MTDFNSILNWKLLAGSHDFPGPDGGTCINEAAIIAAGFEYKKVDSWRDCPPCFSPVIASYALGLNDRMPDKIRNELLLPFVTRLAGTADSREIELERLKLIIRRTKSETDFKSAYAAYAAYAADAYAAADAAAAYAYAADAYAAADAAAAYAVWKITISILDEAIKLGNHSSEVDQGLVIERLTAAKQLQRA